MAIEAARSPIVTSFPACYAESLIRSRSGKQVGAPYLDDEIEIRSIKLDLRDLSFLDGRNNVFGSTQLRSVRLEQRVAFGQKRFTERTLLGDAVYFHAASDQALDRRPQDVDHARRDEHEGDEMCRTA